jgi:hypothetical protein
MVLRRVWDQLASATNAKCRERLASKGISRGPRPRYDAGYPRRSARVVLKQTTYEGGNRIWELTFPDLARLNRRERNTAYWTLLDPTSRAVYPDWERVAREVVYTLRVSVGNEPHNPRIAQLVGELTMRCPKFTGWWSEHRLFERTSGAKKILHAVVGELELNYEAFASTADPGLTMIV